MSDALLLQTYPSGRRVEYERDAAGRVIRVTTREHAGAAAEVVADAIAWLPFGPAAGWIHGNGLVTSRSFDADYRIERILTAGVLDRLYDYDDADNILAIHDGVDPGRSQSFTYDPLLRLTGASGGYGVIDYAYDAVGNRLERSITAAGSLTETYSYQAGSHRLVGVTMDDGNTVTARHLSYTATGATATDVGVTQRALDWNARDRLASITVDGVTTEYAYNALGQRVRKLGAEDRRYHFDRDGQLIAETDGDGSLLREYLWADGLRLAIVAPQPEAAADIVVDSDATLIQGTWLASTAAGGHHGEGYLYAPPVAPVPGLGDEADVMTPGAPPTQPEDPSSADLVVHQPLDETTGGIAFDASGQGRDGTLLGGLDFETDATVGMHGGALGFDGAGFIDLGTWDANGVGALTVAAWVRPTTTAGNQRVLAKDRLGTPGAFILRWQANWQAWVFQVYDVAAGTWRNARFDGTSLHDGDWHHLAGILDAGSGEVRLWVNGVAVDTQPFTAAALNDADGERLVVGAASDTTSAGEPFHGALDDVRVYARRLTGAEIADLAWQPPPVPPAFTEGLALWLPLDETAGDQAADATGHGFDATLEGGDFALASVPGRTGGAVALDGVGMRLDLGAADMAGWDGLTVAAWVQTTATARMRVIAKDRLGTPGNFILRHHDTWNGWVFSAFDPDYGDWRHALWPSQAINDGAWHHVAGVVDTRAGAIRLVVNGETVAEAPFTSATLDDSDGERLVVGADSHPAAPGDWFDGAIDEVRVYHRALAPIELRQLAGPRLLDTADLRKLRQVFHRGDETFGKAPGAARRVGLHEPCPARSVWPQRTVCGAGWIISRRAR